ncbi:MAG: hypothetical protein LUH01_17785 [Parabacteroides gordonii]|nr:hypothetical protein [Parabacteroides gordonii]
MDKVKKETPLKKQCLVVQFKKTVSMKTIEFKERREQILSVFKQSQDDLLELNAEIEKTVEANLQEFERIRQENESLLSIKSDNQKALKFFRKLLK